MKMTMKVETSGRTEHIQKRITDADISTMEFTMLNVLVGFFCARMGDEAAAELLIDLVAEQRAQSGSLVVDGVTVASKESQAPIGGGG